MEEPPAEVEGTCRNVGTRWRGGPTVGGHPPCGLDMGDKFSP
jgi:hypothetical protein